MTINTVDSGLALHPVIASEAKQSMSQRAEAWIASSLSLLAMTRVGCNFAFPRRKGARVLLEIVPLINEGAGNAGCALHRRSRAQWRVVDARMSIQAQRRHPASPASWFYGLCCALPGDEFVLSPSSADLSDSFNPVGFELSPPTWHQQRVSGPHGFAVRSNVVRPARLPDRSRGSTRPATAMARRRSRVHHIPSRVRDDARPPLLPERDGRG